MSRPPLSLRVSIDSDHLSVERISDVELQFILRNEGSGAIEIYPKAAKLAAIASYAGVGITWSLGLFAADRDVPLPVLELRRWYGPPGNPPSPAYAKQLAVSLGRGEEHVERQLACWIPNARLAPEHLAPSALDPQGMDNIGPRSWTPPPGHEMPPPLQETFPLAQASVLVLGTNAATMTTAMQQQSDFLRGHVVAFVPTAGLYDLHVGYAQHSWMGLGKALDVRATPVRLTVE